jgi:SAM-dependent methyltransferase
MDVYAASRAYEIAFSYRDVAAEVAAILSWAERASGAPPASAIEIAAGPGFHALELARRGLTAIALDLSAEMCDLARNRATRENLPLTVVQADMRDFSLSEPVDLAVTMLDSVGHLLTVDDMTRHLRAVEQCVRPHGCYVVEMSHPKDAAPSTHVTLSEWDASDGDEHVHIQWGTPNDRIDELTGVRYVTVTLDYTAGRQQRRTRELVPYRFWSDDDFHRPLSSTRWTITDRFGSFDGIDPAAPNAWRMITVLRKDR